MPTFVLELTFDKDNDRRLAVRPAHREHLAKLYEEGTLVMAGPFADDSGAILIYRAASQEEFEAVLAADPYVVEDVATRVSLRQWAPLFPPEAAG